MFAIKIKERGKTPRKLKPLHIATAKAAYAETAIFFHARLTPARFTYSHGREAGYEKRKGDDLPYGSKQYWRSYMGRKRRQKGHRDPLVFHGESRRQARSVSYTTTSTRATLRYRIRAFSFHPKYKPDFVRLLPKEVIQLGRVFDRAYDRKWKEAR